MVDVADTRKPAGRLSLVIGLALALAGASAGYFAVRVGLLPAASTDRRDMSSSLLAPEVPSKAEDVAFVEIDPVLISLPSDAGLRHLRFRAQVEVAPSHQAEVIRLMPRIVDVLNGYLRALELSDFEEPSALPRLRAQMQKRIDLVVGRDRVRDLLIMEFVLN
jgi:flagellar FliL protein